LLRRRISGQSEKNIAAKTRKMAELNNMKSSRTTAATDLNR
jgi:hypothetical protein